MGIAFNPARYAIENLLLDPVLLGMFLLREKIVDSAGMGLSGGLAYFDVPTSDYQAVADYVCRRVLGEIDPTTSSVQVEYVGGFSASIPASYLDMNGHELETLVCQQIPQLNGYRRDLLSKIAELVCGERPGLVPDEVRRLFLTMMTVE